MTQIGIAIGYFTMRYSILPYLSDNYSEWFADLATFWAIDKTTGRVGMLTGLFSKKAV